ncbi:type II secretion system protein [Ventrimonas sp. CLA-AP-H27]|uniref:Type II secretion system protein n=1 Tax=Ventrimonas faecis TaxID=3133170 RepID=A0ABV1HKF2_9FIRM
MNDTAIRQKKRKGGFTLAEFLVVIAIIMILAGVSFVAAIRYQSRLRRLEMDQTAKEIFLAAQNQLSLSMAEGTFERLLDQAGESGAEEKLGILFQAEGQDGIYCVLYQPGEAERCGEIRNRLLPFGSIDETVRTDGSYLIFYEPGNGAVRAVWYSDRYVFVEGDIESTLLSEAAADPEKREHYTGMNDAFAGHGQPVGYYGGDSAKNPSIDPDSALETPDLTIVNAGMLYAYVGDPNMGKTVGNSSSYQIRLYLEGLSSGAKGWINLRNSGSRVQAQLLSGGYRVILDDLTTENQHFADLNKVGSIVNFEDTRRLIPGEDIRLYVQAFLDGKAGSTVTSASRQENSLFEGKRTDKVLIGNIRHLENLDYRISGFNPVSDGSELGLEPQTGGDGTAQYMALQQKPVSWPDFCSSIKELSGNDTPSVYYRENGKKTGAGFFAPVEPQFALHYNGNSYSIANIPVKTTGSQSGGVFGTVKKDLTVSRLTIAGADITSAASGGALIGAGSGTDLNITVDNVMIQYPMVLSVTRKQATDTKEVDAGAVIGDFSGKALTITKTMAANTWRSGFSAQDDQSTAADLPAETEKTYRIRSVYGIAGGLIGAVNQGSVQISDSAAAVYVDAQDYAGGLIGAARGTRPVDIDNCYVGGHTANGKFLTDPLPGTNTTDAYDQVQGRFNIVSRDSYAGGLAALLPDSSTISHTYVAASVYGRHYGDVAVPTEGTDGKLTIPEAGDDQKRAAFVALSISPASAILPGAAADQEQYSYCYTAAIVNGQKAVVYPESLKSFFGKELTEANKAYPYDKTLGAVYPMPTVFRLNKQDPSASTAGLPGLSTVHVGDWQEFKEEEPQPTTDGPHNGNRLWVDYPLEITGTDVKYLTFAVTGKISGKTMYYVVRTDASGSTYYFTNSGDLSGNLTFKSIDPKVNNENGKRIERIVGEDGKVTIRLYLDDLSYPASSYQNLWDNGLSGDDTQTLVAGEDVDIRRYEEIRTWTEDDVPITCNSLFASVDNNNGVYTAHITNARHLVNLNLCTNMKTSNRRYIPITYAVQDADILWQEDPELQNDEVEDPYCKEISEAYGEVKLYMGKSPQAENSSFWPIGNTDMVSYEGNGHVISKLLVKGLTWGNEGAGLFQKSPHLTISNLNLKDPDMESSQGAAAVIANACVSQWGNVSTGEYLHLKNVHVYGDDMSIRSNSNSGGIAALVDVHDFTMENVSVYGRNALAGGMMNGGYGATGGLVGSLKADSTMQITNCMFSGYVDGTKKQKPTGGLIGDLELSGYSGTDLNKVAIWNSYVAGRNHAYQGTESSVFNDSQINVAGDGYVGGLIGLGNGPLRIVNSFSMAGVRAAGTATGGLIGCHQNAAGLELMQSYFGGTIKKMPVSWRTGILIGQTTEGWNETGGAFPGIIQDCAYIWRSEFGTMQAVGSAWPDADAAKCIPGEASMEAILRYATEAEPATYPYDTALTGSYPYKIWTTENSVKTYRGDWITQ